MALRRPSDEVLQRFEREKTAIQSELGRIAELSDLSESEEWKKVKAWIQRKLDEVEEKIDSVSIPGDRELLILFVRRQTLKGILGLSDYMKLKNALQARLDTKEKEIEDYKKRLKNEP